MDDLTKGIDRCVADGGGWVDIEQFDRFGDEMRLAGAARSLLTAVAGQSVERVGDDGWVGGRLGGR